MTGKHRAEDRHDAGTATSSSKSGTGGKHDASHPGSNPGKTRTDAGKLLGRGHNPSNNK